MEFASQKSKMSARVMRRVVSTCCICSPVTHSLLNSFYSTFDLCFSTDYFLGVVDSPLCTKCDSLRPHLSAEVPLLISISLPPLATSLMDAFSCLLSAS